MREVRFYFDYISPYAYLACREIALRGAVVQPIPVVFGALLDAHGQLGPAEIPAKRTFMIRDCIRRADELGVGFTFPPQHPFRSLDALRASIGQPFALVERLFRACWEEGRDLSDRSVLEELLGRPLSDDLAIKNELKALTDDAIARGVFGVPSFEIQGEIIWGSDRLKDALALAEGTGFVDEARIERVGARRAGVVRPRKR
jgi:2-hydroxychromene-2-carboxylate isomerase